MGKKLPTNKADGKSWLYNEYVNQGRSISAIARGLGLSRSAIEDRLVRFDIAQRESWKKKNERLTRSLKDIVSLYIGDNLTIYEIAARYGVERTSIADLLRKHGHLKSAGEKQAGKFTGEKASNWRGGITPHNLLQRASHKMRWWRKHVFQRDDYTCQSCAKRGGELHADHVLPFSLYPDLRFEILNGRTLCVPCHRKTDTYGRKALSEDLATSYYGVASLDFQ